MRRKERLFAIPIVLLALGIIIFGFQFISEVGSLGLGFVSFGLATGLLMLAYVFWNIG